MQDLVVAVTGASGSIYAVRLLEVLLATGRTVHVTFSPAAVQVFRHELDVNVDLDNFDMSVFSDSDVTHGKLIYHHYADFSSGIASGSFLTGGMVICPCSMGTLASLAHGQSSNLIHRAAEVHLKEHRKLIVVPRETPLSSIQLENMKRLADAGAVVLPAMPAFYHSPITIHDLIDFVVGRICDQLGIRQDMFKRWGAEEPGGQ